MTGPGGSDLLGPGAADGFGAQLHSAATGVAGAQLLGFTVVDLVVVVLVALFALRGWRLGLTGFAFGLAGLVLGALVGVWVAGALPRFGVSPLVQLLVEAGCVLVGALAGSALGGRLGAALGGVLARIHLRLPDRAAGAVVRGALGLALCWVLAAVVVAVGPPSVSSAVQRSAVLGGVSQAVPGAPAAGDLPRLTGPGSLTSALGG